MAKFEVLATPLEGLRVVQPRVIEDARGFFMETYAQGDLASLGINDLFVQDNQSLSHEAGTLRGLHYQTPPHAQAKLVRIIAGSAWDVAVDLRPGSETFGQWFGIELSAANRTQLYVPVGFAHGFLTLEPDTEIVYKVNTPYDAASDAGVRWDDPDLAIAWPDLGRAPILSDKDCSLPLLTDAAAAA